MTPYMRLGNYYALPRIASSDTSHNHAAQHRRASRPAASGAVHREGSPHAQRRAEARRTCVVHGQSAHGAHHLPRPSVRKLWVQVLTIESDVVQARIAKAMGELSTYQERDGIFTKAYVIATAKTMAPAAWWAMYGKHISILSSIASRVLAQPVCASAAERNWSIYGAIKTSARGTMGHAAADKRVYCHEALHLKGKLQAAGYKQLVEKWDSDSDSDESEDEDYAV